MEVPVIDLAAYLSAGEGEVGSEVSELCREVSGILRETGALLVKDPRCTVEDNDRFLDMMEKYFESPFHFKRLQERPNLHYQVPFFSIFVIYFQVKLLIKKKIFFVFLKKKTSIEFAIPVPRDNFSFNFFLRFCSLRRIWGRRREKRWEFE